MIERCRLARIALSLGGPETLLTHPATIARRFTPAERAELGVNDNLVRMSVGLEHVDDLVADLTQALSSPLIRSPPPRNMCAPALGPRTAGHSFARSDPRPPQLV